MDQRNTPPGDACAQTSNEDLLKGCLEHYDRVSTIACEWNNQVPQAIRAWYAAKSKPSAAKPIERCANGEPCGNTETGWCWGRCMKEYSALHSETARIVQVLPLAPQPATITTSTHAAPQVPVGEGSVTTTGATSPAAAAPSDDKAQAETAMTATEQPCRGCNKPLLIENAWMYDGCPCNTPDGVNDGNLYRWRLLSQLQQKQARELEALRTRSAGEGRSDDKWVVEVVKELRGREEALRVQGYWGAADHLKQLIATAPSATTPRIRCMRPCARHEGIPFTFTAYADSVATYCPHCEAESAA